MVLLLDRGRGGTNPGFLPNPGGNCIGKFAYSGQKACRELTLKTHKLHFK